MPMTRAMAGYFWSPCESMGLGLSTVDTCIVDIVDIHDVDIVNMCVISLRAVL